MPACCTITTHLPYSPPPPLCRWSVVNVPRTPSPCQSMATPNRCASVPSATSHTSTTCSILKHHQQLLSDTREHTTPTLHDTHTHTLYKYPFTPSQVNSAYLLTITLIHCICTPTYRSVYTCNYICIICLSHHGQFILYIDSSFHFHNYNL